jgi:hypothetical protein
VKTSIFPFFFLLAVPTLLEGSFSLLEGFRKDLQVACGACVSVGAVEGDEGLLHVDVFFKLADGHLLLLFIL